MMEKYMKEYLDPHNDYELIEWDGGFKIQEHWIAVPEGAEFYVVDNAVKEGRFYKKDDNQLSIFTRESWVKTQYRTDCFYEQMASCGLIIAWQRDNKKEYLEPMPNGDFRYHLGNGVSVGEHWIAVPNGADFFMQSKRDLNYCFFASDNGKTLNTYNGKKWHKESTLCIENMHKQYVLLWRRATQPEELPFIDDEPTAWDIQVGGNHYKQFKIQPMQFALENKLDAAQHNVIKYVMRHASKNGKEDLEKAKHYIDLMIEHYYGDL